MLKYVVCAGSQTEVQAWARLQGISPRQCLYASSTRTIEGLRDFAVVRLRGFFDRADQEEIEACLRRSELKRRSPLVTRHGSGD